MDSESSETPVAYSRNSAAQKRSHWWSFDESSQEIIVVVDLDNGNFFSSPRFELGGNIDEIVSDNETGFSTEVESGRKMLVAALETLSFGPTLRSRLMGEMGNEGWCDVESKGTIIRDANGTPSKIMAVIRDVSRCT